MNIYVELLLTAFVVVFVVDLSGFTRTWKNALGRWLHVDPGNLHARPFDCSLCMTLWTTLAVSLMAGEFTFLTVAYCALLAFLADVIGTAVRLVKDLIIKLTDIISSKL